MLKNIGVHVSVDLSDFFRSIYIQKTKTFGFAVCFSFLVKAPNT